MLFHSFSLDLSQMMEELKSYNREKISTNLNKKDVFPVLTAKRTVLFKLIDLDSPKRLSLIEK